MDGAYRAGIIGRHLAVFRAAALALLLASIVRLAPANAEERVAVLAKMLASTSYKTRLSAVLALAKLGDSSVEKPLVTALRDPSMRVRAVAATALGRLGCEAALPTLQLLARGDPDADVRRAASNAAMKILKTTHLAIERAVKPEGDVEARRSTGAGRAAGRPALDAEPHPDLYVLINSSSDDSPGTTDKTARKMHADIIKRVLTQQCKTEASVTSIAGDAQRWGLDARHIDLSVTRLDIGAARGYVEIDAQLRLTISDDNGKMLSFLSGGAKVQVPSQTFDAKNLPALRKEALENAMRGMFVKLLAHLHDPS